MSRTDYPSSNTSPEPIERLCTERLTQTRCASRISKEDLENVRDAFRTELQVKNPEDDVFMQKEEFWNERTELQAAANYLTTIRTWAPSREKLEYIDARGIILRSAAPPLKFPVSSSNDVVLLLGRYKTYSPELGTFLGMEMKKGLTAKGLRQAEIEFYLWGGRSLFPFVQVVTDMQTGGAAFYKTGGSPAAQNIVLQHFKGMDQVRDFVKGIVGSIPGDAGEDGQDGMMRRPRHMDNPPRKRRRADTPEPDSGTGGASGPQETVYKRLEFSSRGWELIAAMQPDAGNELLADLDAFPISPCADTEDAAISVS